MYDYLIVGAGLFGSVFAREMTNAGKKCLVIDAKSHVGGNCYTENVDGIQVHKYGAHIFHTSDKEIWDYVNKYATFVPFVNSPMANYKGKLYNLPFNMNTFYALWGTVTPDEAREKLASQCVQNPAPQNVEEQALSLVGADVYNTLIKGYTEKQWGRSATELPASIIKRIPVRFTYDNNYFNDTYQGIPKGGYTAMIEALLDGIEVRLNQDFLSDRDGYEAMADKVIYTGAIDEYFAYMHGKLEYRSLRFETERLDTPNFQGNAVVNYTESEVPYTMIIEHKHFEKGNDTNFTVITKEYPVSVEKGKYPYYPVNDEKNGEKYMLYSVLASRQDKVIFGGRLGGYKYYDMDDTVAAALECVKKCLDAKA